MVLAAEVGGRWSVETALHGQPGQGQCPSFPSGLQPTHIPKWSALLACSAVRPFTASFVGPPSSAGSRGHPFDGRGGARCQVCLRVFCAGFQIFAEV